MSSSRYWAALLLAGCGFSPLNTCNNLNSCIPVQVTGLSGYLALELERSLAQALIGIPTCRGNVLKVNVETNPQDLAYGRDATVIRSQIFYRASYQYGNKIGKAQALSSYSVDNNEEFSNMVSQEQAGQRAIFVLAQEIARSLHAQS